MSSETAALQVGRPSPWMIVGILLVGLVLAAIIPPLQSPDEHDHVKRAHMLTRGQIVLHAPPGMPSGGLIDTGLTAYIVAYYGIGTNAHRKLSADEVAVARSIRWTGKREFSPAPGTGYYLPVIYLPQAVGLAIGELLGLRVEHSYHLARISALLTISLLLFAAFSLYRTSPFVIALLVIPMSVFQAASASLDGISNALAIFSIAAFLRLCADRSGKRLRLYVLLAASVVLLAASRVHLLPLLALLPIAGWQFGRRKALLVSGVALGVTLSWLLVAVATTVDMRRDVGASAPTLALLYLRDPLRFLEVLTASFSAHMVFYLHSFVGILGWLDTRFKPVVYTGLTVCLALTALLSMSFRRPACGWLASAVLAAGALASVLLAFFALLITWTPHPATSIEGIQGRYFLVPVLMLAYASAGSLRLHEGIARKGALALVAVIVVWMAFGLPRVLIERYYMPPTQLRPDERLLRPTRVLDADHPIPISLGGEGEAGTRSLGRLGIMFGTYARVNRGAAELRLGTAGGETTTVTIDLARLPDNDYHFFELEPKPYVSARIEAGSGGGVSVWEAHSGDGSRASCVVRAYADGRITTTPGCPPP